MTEKLRILKRAGRWLLFLPGSPHPYVFASWSAALIYAHNYLAFQYELGGIFGGAS